MAGTDPPERSAAPSPAPAAWPVRLRAMLSGRVFLTGCALVVVAILGVFAIRSSAVSDLRVGRISEELTGPSAERHAILVATEIIRPGHHDRGDRLRPKRPAVRRSAAARNCW